MKIILNEIIKHKENKEFNSVLCESSIKINKNYIFIMSINKKIYFKNIKNLNIQNLIKEKLNQDNLVENILEIKKFMDKIFQRNYTLVIEYLKEENNNTLQFFEI